MKTHSPTRKGVEQGKVKVLCLWHATDDEIDYVRKTMPAGTEVVAPRGEDHNFSRFESTYSDLKDHAVDADAFIGWTIPTRILDITERLKLLCWLHAGCDDLRNLGYLSLFKQRGVKVANIRGANAVAVAEHAMMFVLALAKQTLFKDQVAREGRKLYPLFADEYRAAMLSGRTIGVIGVGNIGSRIARFAKAFDMHVLGVRRNKNQPVEHVDAMHGLDELHAVLARCDYVVLATPNTEETHQFFGRPELAAMKPTAFLVNIARGSLIQERPLYEALTSGRLRGFAADAWPRYEFGRAFPNQYLPRSDLFKLPNVIVSNDQAANADDVLHRYLQWGTQSLVEFATGKPIAHEIDLDLGY